MNQNLSRLDKTYTQASTGKLLHRPSDDPHGVGQSIQLKQAIQANEQYERNTTEAYLWLDETDQTISQMVKVMQRVRDLAVQGSNDTATKQDRDAIAVEVNELKEQLQNFANAKVNGDYLFNGQKIDQAPFPDTDSLTNSIFDTGSKLVTIGDGIEVKVNVTGNELFGNGTSNLFASLDNLVNALGEGKDIPLDQIDAGIDRLLTTQAQVGARGNRVDAVTTRIQDSNVELQSMLSKIEDTDYAEIMTKFVSEQSVYQASLMVSSRLFQQSLMDFLR